MARTGSLVAVVLVPAALILAFPGCSPPRRDLGKEEVARAADLEELMWFLATVADPAFKAAAAKPGGDLDAAELEALSKAADRVPWGAARLAEGPFRKEPEFLAFAGALGEKAGALGKAVAAGGGKEASAAALSLKGACAGCHSKYR